MSTSSSESKGGKFNLKEGNPIVPSRKSGCLLIKRKCRHKLSFESQLTKIGFFTEVLISVIRYNDPTFTMDFLLLKLEFLNKKMTYKILISSY